MIDKLEQEIALIKETHQKSTEKLQIEHMKELELLHQTLAASKDQGELVETLEQTIKFYQEACGIQVVSIERGVMPGDEMQEQAVIFTCEHSGRNGSRFLLEKFTIKSLKLHNCRTFKR